MSTPNLLSYNWYDGAETYNASTNKMFQMSTSLMWIISDFLGLGNLFWWNTHTSLACPVCNFDFNPQCLPYSKKWCFMCHYRFLEASHGYRLNKSRLNRNIKLRDPPNILSSSQILTLNVKIIAAKYIIFCSACFKD